MLVETNTIAHDANQLQRIGFATRYLFRCRPRLLSRGIPTAAALAASAASAAALAAATTASSHGLRRSRGCHRSCRVDMHCG